MDYEPGDVLLLNFPFSNATGSRRRPALVLLNTGDDDLVVARITSQPQQTDYDVALKNWQAAGLALPSIVRLHKLATLQKSLIERPLRRLTAEDWSLVQAVIRQLWSL